MTHMNSGNRNNIILRENDNTVVDSNEVCWIFNDYFASIAPSIRFEYGIISVEAAIQKHNRHPSVVMIKDNVTELKTFTFCTVSPDDINHKLKYIDVKMATGYDNVPGRILRLAHIGFMLPLTSLIINCMRNNIFHGKTKLAEVSPSYM